jgi:hypothetical protein
MSVLIVRYTSLNDCHLDSDDGDDDEDDTIHTIECVCMYSVDRTTAYSTTAMLHCATPFNVLLLFRYVCTPTSLTITTNTYDDDE